MYQDEKITLLFTQTSNLISGYLAANPKELPMGAINLLFEKTYITLAAELKKDYIKKNI